MRDEFYSTMAHVLPILLLAFIWDSGFLSRLGRQQRPLRRSDPSGVLFWTKPRVRAYTLTVSGIVVVSIALCLLELAGIMPDSYSLRVGLSIGLIVVLATLMTRIGVDVLAATARLGGSSGSDQASDKASDEASDEASDQASDNPEEHTADPGE
jgi:hypothetical protein